MKFLNKLTVAAVGVVLSFGAIQGQANAASFGDNLVKNGEFEQTEFTSDWTKISDVPYWNTTSSTSNGKIELWNEEKIGSPGMGSDGKGTGKHMETNYNGIDMISQTFTLEENMGGLATFSFDAWSRAGGTGVFWVYGTESGDILGEKEGAGAAIDIDGDSWTKNIFQDLEVRGGQDITIAFQGDQQDSVASPHIDQVSFVVNRRRSNAMAAAVPEPASILGLLAVGAFGSASTLKRKKKQEA